MKEVKPSKKPLIFYYVTAVIVIFLLNGLLFPKLLSPKVQDVDYGTFLEMMNNKQINEVEVSSDEILFRTKQKSLIIIGPVL